MEFGVILLFLVSKFCNTRHINVLMLYNIQLITYCIIDLQKGNNKKNMYKLALLSNYFWLILYNIIFSLCNANFKIIEINLIQRNSIIDKYMTLK